MFCFHMALEFYPKCSACPCDSGLSACVGTALPSAASLIDKESAGGQLT